MDLHSYAKRRGSKKWTVEHKRKLVDARINFDNMFANHPAISLVPWRKFLSLAKLDEFGVMFVRDQWFSLVAKYKQHKQNRLVNLPTRVMDNEMLRRLSEEWEFFEPMHRFMTHRTTNLHSYALKEPNQAEPQASRRGVHRAPRHNVVVKIQPAEKEEQQTLKAILPLESMINDDGVEEEATIYNMAHVSPSSSERINTLCSSDTNDEFAAAVGIRNDHDFYSKKMSYFADGSEDTQESVQHHHHLLRLHDDDDECAVEMQLPAFIREEVAETTTLEPSVYQLQQFKKDELLLDGLKCLKTITLEQQQQQQQQQSIAPKLKTKTFIKRESSRRVAQRLAAAVQVNRTKVGRMGATAQRLAAAVQVNRTKRRMGARPTTTTAASTTTTTTTTKATSSAAAPDPIPEAKSSERDAYYRHKRRYNHRQERRFDALLSVFGQIVKAEYPSVDLSALSAIAITATVSSDEEM